MDLTSCGHHTTKTQKKTQQKEKENAQIKYEHRIENTLQCAVRRFRRGAYSILNVQDEENWTLSQSS